MDVRTISYAYTLADRLACITYPSGAIVSYGRDATVRISSVTRKPDVASAPLAIVSAASKY